MAQQIKKLFTLAALPGIFIKAQVSGVEALSIDTNMNSPFMRHLYSGYRLIIRPIIEACSPIIIF